MILFEWVIPATLVGLAGLTLGKKGQEIKTKYHQLQKRELEKLENKNNSAKAATGRQHDNENEATKEQSNVGELELEETI